jgi:hypothetical protein
MPEDKAKASARRAKYRAAGVCQINPRHGPIVRLGLCEPCAAYHASILRRRYLGAKLAGMCAQGASHGPATQGRLCSACKAKRRIEDLTRCEARKRAKLLPRPTCSRSADHGPATIGTMCRDCAQAHAAERKRGGAREAEQKARRVVLCAFGTPHGPAVEGPWCAACVDRRSLAAQRLAERARIMPQTKPEGPRAPVSNGISTLKSHIKRVGTMDSSGLLDCLLFNK